MSLSDDIKSALEADDDLMDLLTGGIFAGVEEVSRQNTPGAFDANGEIQPCALIKEGVESRFGPYLRGVRSPFNIYFYQRGAYDVIEPAMDIVFDLLNEKQVGSKCWNIVYVNGIRQQRDPALDCALGALIFNSIREK